MECPGVVQEAGLPSLLPTCLPVPHPSILCCGFSCISLSAPPCPARPSLGSAPRTEAGRMRGALAHHWPVWKCFVQGVRCVWFSDGRSGGARRPLKAGRRGCAQRGRAGLRRVLCHSLVDVSRAFSPGRTLGASCMARALSPQQRPRWSGNSRVALRLGPPCEEDSPVTPRAFLFQTAAF